MDANSIVSFAVETFQSGVPENPFLNIYWYKVTNVPANAPLTFSPADWAILGAEFTDIVVAAHKVIASNQLLFRGIHMIEQDDPLKPFGDYGLSNGPGGVAQGMLADFDAYGFRLIRQNNQTRNGYKRLPGVPVGAFINGAIQSGFTAGVGAMAAAIEDVINVSILGEAWQFAPVIVRRDVTGMPTANQTPSDVVFYGATSQNTRKR